MFKKESTSEFDAVSTDRVSGNPNIPDSSRVVLFSQLESHNQIPRCQGGSGGGGSNDNNNAVAAILVPRLAKSLKCCKDSAHATEFTIQVGDQLTI